MRKSFLVELRHSRLSEPISRQLRFELLRGNRWLLAPFCHDRQVFQILDQFLVVRERQHDGGFLSGLVG
ncbi:MAG: hypothetical protein ACKVVO_13945 [Opitutaceae bacterium]